MPLSAQTCLLVWRAMAACGLRDGKINSFEDEHFGPNYSWQQHLVEGRTAQGIFAENAKIQAKLTEQDGGTLLEFMAGNIRRQTDFGSAKRVRLRLMPLIEQFLREEPTEGPQRRRGGWNSDRPLSPLAAPTAGGAPAIPDEPRFDVIVPINENVEWEKSLAVLMSVVFTFLIVGVGHTHLVGPAFVLMAGWQFWNWQKQEQKWTWLPVGIVLCSLVWGLYNSWLLIKRWI